MSFMWRMNGATYFASTVELGTMICPFSNNVARAHERDVVRLQLGFFSLSSLFYSFPRKNAFEVPKKQLYHSVCNLIDFFILLINVYLTLDAFWSLYFFSFSSLGIFFNLIFYMNWSLTFNCFIFVLIRFSFFFQFLPF